ncbi:calcium-translocating P-type ATPase, PMCA-type [Fulvivirgaceae bacterium PWU4]|uniref:P-type Ca(2+) transporter n=1 Tax=Chryseosolibacter histidini TaxID=2782349 RepID=A0AAP2DK39_9BACT|nr:calcium-translocating P-type ATPase, PMCA-type [Chryseosolibacter histidini]MBT1695324.1 calcium-translocating P-type ATPase, PMCA-type [Chryseosolibacter histidini]
MDHHLQPSEKVAEALKTSRSGLDPQTAQQRITEHGKNVLEVKKKKTLLGMLLTQLTDFMILILMAAAVISGIIGDLTDTIVILAIVVINAIIGLIQEWRAEKAMEALESMAASHARVLRNNQILDIPAADLVPGDVVQLEAGNIIPADIRFIETYTLKVDESSLTGESMNIEKSVDPLPPKTYPLGDRVNMGYKGTFVTNGRGVGYVVATGMKTELGRIAKMIQVAEIKTPLQKRLEVFGKRLTLIILILCAVFFLVGWWRGEAWSTMLLTSISLAVAAIPEALPALVTIALALGARRLVKSNALIRKLPAVETLGSVTYICSDKTGTLTLNKMTVQEIFEPQEVTSTLSVFKGKDILLHALALNNDVTKDKDGVWVGESTEVALVQYAQDHGYDRFALESEYARVAELPFDSKRKSMTTFHRNGSGVIAIVKGAVDVLVRKLEPTQQALIPSLERRADEMAGKGFRTLGYAIRMFDTMPATQNTGEIESSLTFIGLAGMMDPPRDEARQAVTECKTAGIHPVMITGDHKLTAQAIARNLGILSAESDLVLSGPELQKLSDDEFDAEVERVRVYARVDPEQKLRIIGALQRRHHFVAMTGDGVNDAPALKNADIGIAMGINGTEVSKEASHMILLDDNFATIVKAVKHGRRIFDNILKFIKYIMTGNSGEIWALFLAPFFNLPIPLLAIHILWVNLITDGLPGLALASEPAEADIMKRPPRDPKQSIFSGGMGWHILWVGLLMGLVTLGMQAWAIHYAGAHWQTMAFTVLCFAQLGHVMAIRSEHRSFFRTSLLSNKPLLGALLFTSGLQLMVIYTPFFNEIFKTQPLTLGELAISIAVASIVFWAVELEKFLKNRRINVPMY